MRRKAYSRGERKEQIANVFIDAMQSGQPNRLTMYQVAKRMDLAPSTKLQEIMLEMVADGVLSFIAENKGNSWRRVFSLCNVQPQVRNIRINGIQLEMKF